MSKIRSVMALLLIAGVPAFCFDDDDDENNRRACNDLPSYSTVKSALSAVVTAGGNGGLAFNMWATVVSRDGVVCSVSFSGANRGAQWPGSRVISAQKANTAN